MVEGARQEDQEVEEEAPLLALEVDKEAAQAPAPAGGGLGYPEGVSQDTIALGPCHK